VPSPQTSTAVPTPESATVTTDASGAASFSFTSATAGGVQVTATFTNAEGAAVTATLDTTFVAAGAGDTTAPTFVSAVAGANTDTMVVTYSEALQCSTVEADASDYDVTTTGGTTFNPDVVDCTGEVVTLQFPGTPFTNEQGTVTKVPGAVVEDLAGNNQADGDAVPFTTA